MLRGLPLVALLVVSTNFVGIGSSPRFAFAMTSSEKSGMASVTDEADAGGGGGANKCCCSANCQGGAETPG